MPAIPFVLAALLAQGQPPPTQALTPPPVVQAPAQPPPAYLPPAYQPPGYPSQSNPSQSFQSQASPPPPPSRFRIIEIHDGILVIDAGLNAGLQPGQHVKVLSQQTELDTGHMAETSRQTPTTVVALDRVAANRSIASLGRGDLAAVGDLVERTTDSLSQRIVTPPRAPFEWQLGFLARPFLGLDDQNAKPVGILADVYAAYYFQDIPLKLEVSAMPMGFAVGSLEAHYPGLLTALAALSFDYFEVGLGFGGAVGSPAVCNPPLGTGQCGSPLGTVFAQSLRLGAIDGLNLLWESTVLAGGTSWVLGPVRVETNIPIANHYSLYLDAGGSPDWGFADLGLRSYLRGTGGPGTVILSAGLGFASLSDGPPGEVVQGPSINFGAEWRL